jgi:hypothetical protein
MEATNKEKFELYLNERIEPQIELIKKRGIDVDIQIEKINLYKDKILNNDLVDDGILINSQNFGCLQNFINDVLHFFDGFFTLDSNIVKYFLQPKHLKSNWNHKTLQIILYLVFKHDKTEINIKKAITTLSDYGFNHEDLYPHLNSYLTYFNYENNEPTNDLSCLGHYLIILNKTNPNYNIGAFLLNEHVNHNFSWSNDFIKFKFLLAYFPLVLNNQEAQFIFNKDSYSSNYNYDERCANLLLQTNKEIGEKILLDGIKNYSLAAETVFSIYYLLHFYFPKKYETKIEEIGNDYLFKTCMAQKAQANYYYNYEPNTKIPGYSFGMSKAILKYWIEKDAVKAYELATEYVTKADIIYPGFIQFVNEEYKEKALPILLLTLNKNSKTISNSLFIDVLRYVEQYNILKAETELIDFAINRASKKERIYTAKILSSLENNIIETTTNLLLDKNVDSRITGALILSNIKEDKVEAILTSVVNTEKNDDTRDIIIENLQEQLYSKTFTIEDCKSLINYAAQRTKLAKLNEKFIDETAMPNLNWNDGSALSTEEKRFLLYRMARSKGLNSDIEARKVVQCIDKNTSGAFSKFLLKCFADSDSNTKFKYYISLAAMLGGNESIAQLNTLFRNAITDKRVKLAEMIVAALAMVGTNKALLSVESISRKFANKKPAISAAANAALEAAAEELNITKEELGDRIIPTFDFDGIFKEFELEGVTYRAFVDKDFTLCFYDENNKMRKSFPKNITKELKTEFTEINKEIKNVVKSQTGRLESFLMENRKWSVEDWQTYFLNHPIMIVYATHLLWIVYDADGKVKSSILCQEDGSIVNINDEEITLAETDTVGLYHPIFVNETENTNWNTKLYDKNFTTIFPQTNRTIFTPLEDELEKNVSERYNNKEIPKGADYTKSFMEKAGWLKISGDGGSAEFSKKFESIGLTISPYIEGPSSWYQEGKEKAIIHQIYFQGKNYSEKFLIKDVPPVIYSEIMAGFETLIATV